MNPKPPPKTIPKLMEIIAFLNIIFPTDGGPRRGPTGAHGTDGGGPRGPRPTRPASGLGPRDGRGGPTGAPLANISESREYFEV